MLSKEKLLNIFTDEDIIDATKIYEKYKLQKTLGGNY